MKTITHRPAPSLWNLQQEVERLFGDLAASETRTPNTWTPRLDVVEYSDRFEVMFDLPGVEKDKVSISLENDTLEVSGERTNEMNEDGKTYHRCECVSGTFARKVTFPTMVNGEGITAKLHSGVLTVVVPKSDEVKARPIPIQ